MLFNSYEFIFVFLPISLIIFFLTSKLKPHWLVLSSLFFYCWWNVYYVPLLVASVCINYFISTRTTSKFWLIIGVGINFVVLGICKCIGVLPLGISFFTFTQTAYLVNVYRGMAKPEGFVHYAEYVTFFGYITSGPIADYREMMPQFRRIGKPNYDMLAKGITLFALGLFKKVYIADSIAPVVNLMFRQTEVLTFFEAWAAALGYSMQLYFDFSGYSDMAVAIGLMFGLRVPENFRSPYKSLSVIEFWRRWHMSLGVWVRDYVYIPLGGSRKGDLKRTRNVMLAMLFTGLWHGLGWTFVVWGVLHGVMLAVNHQWRRTGLRLPAAVSWGLTFGGVMLGWIVFRAKSLGEAGTIFRSMVGGNGIVLPVRLARYARIFEVLGIIFRTGRSSYVNTKMIFIAVLISILCPNSKEIILRFKPNILWLLVLFMLIVMSFMEFSGVSDFLYFQF